MSPRRPLLPDVYWSALLSAALVAIVVVFYLVTINGEDEGEVSSSRVQFVAGSLIAGALCCAVGAVLRPGVLRLALLAGGGFMLLLLTFIGVFSIGILLVIPTVLALRAAGKAARDVPGAQLYAVTAAAGFAALLIVALGLANTT
jgi:hypothetical protein